MIPVKRNGVFQYTERLEPNDVIIRDRPHKFAELDETGSWKINIEQMKQAKIDHFKNEIASKLVYIKAPEFKQVNAALGIYPAETKKEIVSWIKAVRKLSDKIESQINDLKEIQDIDNFTFDFETLKLKAAESEEVTAS
ncbi:MAG: hypothetical protein WCG23_12915 [bacterium]